MKSGADVLAAFSDNVAQLIDPLDMRNAVIAISNDVGFIADSDPYSISVSATPSSMLTPMPSPAPALRFWTVDGNNNLISDYAIPVDPGVVRLLSIRFAFIASKSGGGISDISVQRFLGGVASGEPWEFQTDSTARSYALDGALLYDYETPLPIDYRISGDTQTVDIEAIGLEIIGSML